MANLIHNCFILQYAYYDPYMFRALYAHHQEVELFDAASGIVALSKWLSGTQVHLTAFVQHLLTWKNNKYYVFCLCVCSLR